MQFLAFVYGYLKMAIQIVAETVFKNLQIYMRVFVVRFAQR